MIINCIVKPNDESIPVELFLDVRAMLDRFAVLESEGQTDMKISVVEI